VLFYLTGVRLQCAENLFLTKTWLISRPSRYASQGDPHGRHRSDWRSPYPTHGDNAKKFLDAHRYFGIPYPVNDFSDAWETILGRYFYAMRTFMSALSTAWKGRS